MKCLNCSSEVPGHSRFCLRCGTPLAGGVTGQPLSNPGGTFAVPARTSMNPKAIAGIVVLALLALGLLGWTISGQFLQKADKSASGSMVQAPAQASAPGALVQAPTAVNPGAMVQAPTAAVPAAAPVQAAAGTAPNTAEIEDYLKFVQNQQLMRFDLQGKMKGEIETLPAKMLQMQGDVATGEQSEQNYVNGAKSPMKAISDKFNELAGAFSSRKPPADGSCDELFKTYWEVLNKTQGQSSELEKLLSDFQTNPAKSSEIAGSIENIDVHAVDKAAAIANNSLHAIFQKYNIAPFFDITADGTTASPVR